MSLGIESIKKCLKNDYQIKRVQSYYAIQHKFPQGRGKNVAEIKIRDGYLLVEIESRFLTEYEKSLFETRDVGFRGITKDLQVKCNNEVEFEYIMKRAYEGFYKKYM